MDLSKLLAQKMGGIGGGSKDANKTVGNVTQAPHAGPGPQAASDAMSKGGLVGNLNLEPVPTSQKTAEHDSNKTISTSRQAMLNLRAANMKKDQINKDKLLGNGGYLNEAPADEEERKKQYKLTAYMKQYNELTFMDYTKGFEPSKMDDFYSQKGYYQKTNSVMPNQVDFTFDVKFSGIDIDKSTLEALQDLFDKFQSDNSIILKPSHMKREYEKHKLNLTHPSMYSMICWITDANEFSGTEGMTFEEFVQYAVFFFSQRYHEEGLKYIFEILDTKQQGYLTKKEFDDAAQNCGLNLSKEKLDEIFTKSSSNGEILRFSDFAFFMRAEKM